MQLWHVGGAYRVDGRGFHNARGGNGLRRHNLSEIAKRQRAAGELYRANHGGREPTEAVGGALVYPNRVVCVGRCRAVAYRNDKGNGKGRVNYRHAFAEDHARSEQRENMPFIDVSENGTRFFFRGGSYELRDGWLID